MLYLQRKKIQRILREKQALEKELKAHRRAALHCDGVCVLYGICELAGQRLGLVMKRYRCSLDVCLREASAGGARLDEKRVSAWSIKLFRTLRQRGVRRCWLRTHATRREIRALSCLRYTLCALCDRAY